MMTANQLRCRIVVLLKEYLVCVVVVAVVVVVVVSNKERKGNQQTRTTMENLQAAEAIELTATADDAVAAVVVVANTIKMCC
jgi:translation elongation factor P/translation initiation factor 5A